jgi:uncharacterized protein
MTTLSEANAGANAGANKAAEIFEGISIIDCDAHFTEPADLWSSRAPGSLKDRFPEHRTINGVTAWFLDGELWASIGGNTIRRGHEKVLGAHVVQPFEEIDASAWDVSRRLELLDIMGIHAQILYPNGIGFASNHIFAIEDQRQRTAVLQVYNDFLADLQAQSRDRLFPQALLPIWDMDLTVKEMTRMLDRGIRGFTLSDKPELLGLPELPEPYFTPMWDLLNDSGAVASFHIGAGARKEEIEALRAARNKPRGPAAPSQGSRPIPAAASPAWQYFGPQRQLAVTATQMYMSNVRVVANLCMSDLFDRHPKLKIVSAESGIGWVPFLLEALEFQLDEMVTDPAERSLQQRRPTEYFRDHVYVMFWFEQVGPRKQIGDIGIGNVLVETDVPHPTCLYPGAREHFANVMAELEPAVRRRVLQDNAAGLYRIPLAQGRP